MVKWRKGLLYNALHNVGDDPIKVMIEESLANEFQFEPAVLDKIASIFVECTKEE